MIAHPDFFKPFSVLYTRLMPELPGCPTPLIDQHIEDALRTFCEDTHAWNCNLEPITLRAARAAYPIDNPVEGYGEPWSIMTVERNGRRLRPGVDFMATPCDITLHCIPATDERRALVIRAALVPTDGTRHIAQQLYADWAKTLAPAIKASLMLIPNETWSNPAMAQAHRMDAYNGYANAKIKVMREMSNNIPGTVKPTHPFI